jgi:hypothetical protein
MSLWAICIFLNSAAAAARWQQSAASAAAWLAAAHAARRRAVIGTYLFSYFIRNYIEILKKKQLFVCSPFGDECLKMIITI